MGCPSLGVPSVELGTLELDMEWTWSIRILGWSQGAGEFFAMYVFVAEKCQCQVESALPLSFFLSLQTYYIVRHTILVAQTHPAHDDVI